MMPARVKCLKLTSAYSGKNFIQIPYKEWYDTLRIIRKCQDEKSGLNRFNLLLISIQLITLRLN